MRNTKQKTVILEYLRNNKHVHITADELIDGLKLQGTPVARATVYRYLSVLEEQNLVRRFTLSENAPACYQFTGGNQECFQHYHLLCQSCGGLVHFEDESLQKTLSETVCRHGFTIDSGKITFYGKCRDCCT